MTLCAKILLDLPLSKPTEKQMSDAFHIMTVNVGMSTVPEVIVARHAGIEVFAVSVITDLGVEGIVEKCSHEEVQKAAAEAQPRMSFIMKELVEQF